MKSSAGPGKPDGLWWFAAIDSNYSQLSNTTSELPRQEVNGRAGMTNTTDGESVLTIDELAAYLKVAKSTLCKLFQEGKVPGQKVGRHWRFRKETIDRWLDEEQSEESR